MASDATGQDVPDTACDTTDSPVPDKDSAPKETNGGIPKKPGSEKDSESNEKDGQKGESEGLFMDCLRSPKQTRVRRISAELRLSASSSVENIRKAGKGFSSGLQNVANKLPVPRSLQRRSRSYENLEENSLLHPDTTKADGGGDDIRKSKSSENLKKIKDDKDDGGRGDKRFLRRKWEARKSRQQQENKSDEKSETKKEETVSVDDAPQDDDGLAVDSIPVVFEPLTLGQRPLTPTVTICLTDDENRNTNPFLD